jgi:catechol 2,3-dioxygenase-like lactoylglutathione lyase family enzyme
MTAPPSEFQHVSIVVSDAERSLAFYREVFGFERWLTAEAGAAHGPVLGLADPDLSFTSHFLTRGGVRLELIAFDRPEPARPDPASPAFGFTHLAFSSADLPALTAAVAQHGGQVVQGAQVAYPDGSSFVMCLDPDGVRIELFDVRGWSPPAS